MEINIFGIQICIKKVIIAIGAVVLVLILVTAGFIIKKNNKSIIIDKSDNAGLTQKVEKTGSGGITQADNSKEPEVTKQEPEIKVYVVGCVKTPGIVALKKGQIISDAIEAAGGATEEADLNNINLAYELQSNTMLKIKSRKEVQKASSVAGQQVQGVEIIKDSGGAVTNDSAGNDKKNGKININTASAGELDTLPGIGQQTAQDIINFRDKNGPFKKIQDVMKIPGIKESKFNKIKDLITAE